MNSVMGSRCHGWVSLPIVVLLMLVAGLGVAYQQQLLGHQQWREQLQESRASQDTWLLFEDEVVRQVVWDSAQPSHCVTFCSVSSLSPSSHGTRLVWRNKGERIPYQFDYYISPQKIRFSRLCATQQGGFYHCWWWKQKRLVSKAKVMQTD